MIAIFFQGIAYIGWVYTVTKYAVDIRVNLIVAVALGVVMGILVTEKLWRKR